MSTNPAMDTTYSIVCYSVNVYQSRNGYDISCQIQFSVCLAFITKCRMAYMTFTNVFLRPKLVLMSIFNWIHCVFKFLCYFLILSNSLCFLLRFKRTFCCYNLQFLLHLKPFKVFSCITSLQKGSLGPLLVFLHFIPIFCIKSYKRVFWSFPTKESILVPTICPWVFSIRLYKSFVKFCTKSS